MLDEDDPNRVSNFTYNYFIKFLLDFGLWPRRGVCVLDNMMVPEWLVVTAVGYGSMHHACKK